MLLYIFYLKFIFPVVYADVKISWCVYFGYCVKLLNDIVCSPWTKLFCCEEGNIGLFCMQESHSVDIK